MMNEHIFFNVQELQSHNIDTYNIDTYNIDTYDTYNNFNLDIIEMNNSPYDDYLAYMNNYTVKNLINILGYYNINKNKLVKDEMVQLIILFENEPTNKNIVYQRKRLWKNILELKNNDYFKKFILF
jgi:hypothetical protein